MICSGLSMMRSWIGRNAFGGGGVIVCGALMAFSLTTCGGELVAGTTSALLGRAAPALATELEAALFHAFRSVDSVPRTAMQLHNIATHRRHS